jgi:thymidylate synthase (FAD)
MISATLLKYMGDDLDVVNAAKVSFAKESKEFNDNSDRLIKYLAKHKHMSPFGHCFARFHVKAPIFVARQLVKHKFLRWNEVSRRYVDDEPEFYVPDVWRGRSADKKQGSSDEEIKEFLVQGGDRYTPDHLKLMMEINDGYDSVMNECCLALYRDFIKAGVAPEQARMVLPQSTMTEWWWSGSLDAFADMCNLRCTGDTQLETRLVANDICDKMRELFPVSWLALRGL